MATSADARAVIAAAEQAAAAGDYALAERHLRDAAALQEAEWGPVHPDLANTLNNLGVACERAGRLDDAEAAYRRAYQIAVRALAPGDPLVARSADNLRDFCAARGSPFDLDVLREPPRVAPPATKPEPTEGFVSAPARRSFAIPALVLLLAALAGLWWWLGRALPGTEDSVVVSAPPAAVVPSSPPADVLESPPAEPAPPKPVVPAGDDDRVVTASVCASFSTQGTEWSCEPIGVSVPAGRSLVFYTRVRSARATTIEHLWFDGDTLHQRVELPIAANPGAGYRTYSRATVTAGAWRVELREEGVLLRDVSFSVR